MREVGVNPEFSPQGRKGARKAQRKMLGAKENTDSVSLEVCSDVGLEWAKIKR
jgi:hypothetical protein